MDAGVPGAGVRRLMVTDFRSYTSAVLESGIGPIVLTGPNGAGKTNLLEAVSMLSPGRGLRRATLSEMVRNGAERWAIAAEAETVNGACSIGTGLNNDNGSERRIARIDGETVGPAALGGLLPVSWLTPQMDRLFLDGASARRRFVDRLIFGFDPGHASRSNAYEKAMRERLRLLKDGRMDVAWLSALEAQMAEHGVAIAAARRAWSLRIGGALRQMTGPFPAAEIALQGVAEELLADRPAVQVEEDLATRWRDGRGLDRHAGRTTDGPHRSDLLVRHVAKDIPAEQCSTGEQKALLISLILADARMQQAERGVVPIMLLDEVAAHLDSARRSALFDEISALGGQAWLTGTDRELFAAFGTRAQYFGIDGSMVTPG